ncbi:hexapeptide repeat-containing transferase [Caldithrix abyssi DSM 13497]|uniref:Hexapeptide repeat-containing transferase n=1 Tax=Caldithrix abyssi DSM 13497 TaxID=880073 RepID=H1XS55_CALAY|nr:acyltransferase [Caldithrix abyssi]APF20158.1 transferase hexapeptide (six repeat-containing protein) [Caldithrix abyssi DSM 13497]EHO40219.1 hexapeptide repeat-containing transferase [Caldithrix abyssi DSM 13497]
MRYKEKKISKIYTDKIGKNVKIGDFCIIKNGVSLEDDVIIHPNVIIEENVVIKKGTEIFPGTYIGKIPKGAGATAREIEFNKKILIGKNCAIGPNAIIFYDVEIGDNSLIGDGASIREKCKIGQNCLISRYVTINYNTKIGNNTKIMDLTHITGNCYIGNNVFISVLVSTTNDNIVVTREFDEIRIKGPIIKDGVTIGASASILPAITIGEGAFVAAGSVVTRDVDAFTLVRGAPARFVKTIKNGEL